MTIAHYTIAGQAVESEILLPEFGPTRNDGAAGIRVRLGRVRPAPQRVVAQERLEDGTLWRVVFGVEEGYLFHFPGLALFEVSRQGDRIDIFPDPEIPEETVRHLLLDQVLPYLALSWGGIVLHASGVATPCGAVGFLGATGRGKSTLAAAFARRGFGVLCDDCFCVLEKECGFRAQPWYPGLRLWPDHLGTTRDSSEVAHYTRKRRVAVSAQGADEEPVRAIYLLEAPASDGRIRIEKVSPRDAAVELTRHAFFLDPEDRPAFHRFFDRIGRLSESAPLYRLSYPRSLESLDGVIEEVAANEESLALK